MVVRSDVAHDARIVREASALAGAGHAVHVIGKDVPEGYRPPDGVTVQGVGARSAFRRPGTRSSALPAHLKMARWLLLPRHNASVWASFLAAAEAAVGERRFDVVHVHDFPVLPLGARLAAATGARLVYDSHELWSGRLRAGRPTPVGDRRELALERALGSRADVVLTVSGPIADRMRTWGWRDVRVVRNTFPLGDPAPGAAPAPADGAADGGPPGAVYAGRLGAGRDLHTVVAAAALRPDLHWALVGPRDEAYWATLPVPPSIAVRDTLAVDDVDAVLREHGLSLVTLEDTCENHRVALPNKLFQAVRAGVPVVAADLPAMREVVQRHGLGTLYRPGDPSSLADAVARAALDVDRLRANVRAARAELSWERDAQVLLGAYADLEQRVGAR